MVNRKYQPVSIHQTLHGTLKVDWESQYKNEYNCPDCKENIKNYRFEKKSKCKFELNVNAQSPLVAIEK